VCAIGDEDEDVGGEAKWWPSEIFLFFCLITFVRAEKNNQRKMSRGGERARE